MNLFNVYPRFDITPTKASGMFVYDQKDQEYLDLYGGHGVISLGHSHPYYVEKLEGQLQRIGFYSNSVNMPIQEEFAAKLGRVSACEDYDLFLCNSGAEANENALKIASFHTGKKKVISFKKSFHGRTAGSLNITDNPKISAPINKDNFPVEWCELNDEDAVLKAMEGENVAAVIVEGIQGVGGLDMPSEGYLQFLSKTCKENGALLILDEIQCGYGRTGKFFAHQYAGIKPDIISVAKGMGNGFPIGGVLIAPSIEAHAGMLGTTFGGNHLACAAGIAVLDVMENENLMGNVLKIQNILIKELESIPAIKEIKGKGLMLGLKFHFPIKEIRAKLLFEHHVFTGAASDSELLRILPPLCMEEKHVNTFVEALKKVLK